MQLLMRLCGDQCGDVNDSHGSYRSTSAIEASISTLPTDVQFSEAVVPVVVLSCIRCSSSSWSGINLDGNHGCYYIFCGAQPLLFFINTTGMGHSTVQHLSATLGKLDHLRQPIVHAEASHLFSRGSLQLGAELSWRGGVMLWPGATSSAKHMGSITSSRDKC
uniref:Uncharacterized protein n=1 Tax=Arundo donax TaxID=35708 RepID=A0A0A8XVH4_ARUDO